MLTPLQQTPNGQAPISHCQEDSSPGNPLWASAAMAAMTALPGRSVIAPSTASKLVVWAAELAGIRSKKPKKRGNRWKGCHV